MLKCSIKSLNPVKFTLSLSDTIVDSDWLLQKLHSHINLFIIFMLINVDFMCIVSPLQV